MLSYVIPTAEDKPNPFRPPDEDSPHASHEGGEEPQSSAAQPGGSQTHQTDLVDPNAIDSQENGHVETAGETSESPRASKRDFETKIDRTTSVSVDLGQTSRKVVADRIVEEGEDDDQAADGSLSECRSLQSDSLATPGSEDRSVSKLTKPALKRVSFGSSKGSMVETLIYDTSITDDRTPDTIKCPAPAPPQPIRDPVALKFGSEVAAPQKPASKVRVSFFESDHPQVVASPEPSELDSPCSSLLRDCVPSSAMASSPGLHAGLDRQLSSESGRDNPFRPDGDISKEADEIVQRIKSGQPLLNGGHPTSPNADSSSSPPAGSPAASSPSPSHSPVAEPEISKTDSGNAQQQGAPPSSQNGTTAATAPPLQAKATPASPSTVEVTHSTLPASQPAAAPQHVVLKKKNKCGCCVLQ